MDWDGAVIELTQGCRNRVGAGVALMVSDLAELINISSDFPELNRIWSDLVGAKII